MVNVFNLELDMKRSPFAGYPDMNALVKLIFEFVI
jgi:hypothetical protein